MSYSEPLKIVLEKAGGPTLLAAALKIGASAVAQWTDVPPRHLFRVSAITGIPASEIRPDLMPPTPAEKQAAE